MPQLVPPVPNVSDSDDVVYDTEWQQLFVQLRKLVNNPVFHSQATNPGTAGVPNGTWAVWKNTTSGEVRLWANDGGVMKSVLLS